MPTRKYADTFLFTLENVAILPRNTIFELKLVLADVPSCLELPYCLVHILSHGALMWVWQASAGATGAIEDWFHCRKCWDQDCETSAGAASTLYLAEKSEPLEETCGTLQGISQTGKTDKDDQSLFLSNVFKLKVFRRQSSLSHCFSI